MRSVTYQSVQDSLTSTKVGVSALLDDEKIAFRRSFVNAYRDAWYGCLWPFSITTAEITPDTFGQTDLTAITDFDQALDVYRYDPNKSSDVTRYSFRLEGDTLTVNDKRVNGSSEGSSSSGSTTLSLKYKKQEPIFQGSDYNTASTYSSGDVVYFTQSGVTGYEGDWYKANTAVIVGQDPYSTSASWTKQTVSHELSQHVLYMCYADWLMADSQHSKAAVALGMAENYLFKSMDRLERESGQANQTSVVGYTSALSNGYSYV